VDYHEEQKLKEFKVDQSVLTPRMAQHPRQTAVMINWKMKIKRQGIKASRTPGKTKSETCQTSPLKSTLAKRGRGWKHPLYGQWCRGVGQFKGIEPSMRAKAA
jgi:hypothetical protein